jgi:hypothetical protein
MTASRNFLLALAAAVIAPFMLALLPGGAPDAPRVQAAIAEPAGNAVSAEGAARHRGIFATVEGVVRNVHTARSGSATFLDIGGVYPDNPFSAVIFADDMARVGDVSGLVGRAVSITGKISKIRMYRGKPEIIVAARNQIAVQGNPARGDENFSVR